MIYISFDMAIPWEFVLCVSSYKKRYKGDARYGVSKSRRFKAWGNGNL